MTTQYPVFIICRDRLEPLLRLLAWLETAGHRRIVLLDNDSAYARSSTSTGRHATT